MTGGMEVYVEGSPAERRIGVLDTDGHPLAFEIDRMGRPQQRGGIYRARVRSVDTRMGAAWLDLGLDRPALLTRAKDVTEGEAVTVQIVREAHGDKKGPAVSRQIVLWGRYAALHPGEGAELRAARGLGQGRRRAETMAAVAPLLEDPRGLVLRTPAAAVDPATVAAEAAALRQRWREIEAAAAKAQPPAALDAPAETLLRVLREAGPAARIALDDRLDYAEAERLARAAYPDLVPGLAFHDASAPIFEASGLADALEEALGIMVALPGGGRITIEETRALTAIDVDMGGAEQGESLKPEALHRLNRRAAETIARQIRLRRLSGLIAIDFAGLLPRGRSKSLIDVLRSRLKDAPENTDVLGLSAAGLGEITRQRIGPSLAEECLAPAAERAPAPDALAADALRRALRLTGAGRPVLDLPEAAARALDGALKPARLETERRLGQELEIRRGAARHPDIRMER
jgi:Rne/Rng family ribonuclease